MELTSKPWLIQLGRQYSLHVGKVYRVKEARMFAPYGYDHFNQRDMGPWPEYLIESVRGWHEMEWMGEENIRPARFTPRRRFRYVNDICVFGLNPENPRIKTQNPRNRIYDV